MSQQAPSFSIIIPTYNVVELLPQALDSVVNQTFKKWEVVVMDGLSSDGTVEITEKYAVNNPRIKVYSEKDMGIYDAMNNALQRASGKYIHFLGSDDKFYDNKVLEDVDSALKKNPVDVIYGDVFSTRFDGRYAGEFSVKKIAVQNICHQAMFVHREVFIKKGDFSLQFTAHADYLHNLHWFLDKSISRLYIDRVITNYADGGFSSIHGDPEFEKKKSGIFLELAIKHQHYAEFFFVLGRQLKARKKRITAWLKGKNKG